MSAAGFEKGGAGNPPGQPITGHFHSATRHRLGRGASARHTAGAGEQRLRKGFGALGENQPNRAPLRDATARRANAVLGWLNENLQVEQGGDSPPGADLGVTLPGPESGSGAHSQSGRGQSG